MPVPHIEGLGGAFIESADPDALSEWYQRVLGLALEAMPDGTGHFRVFPHRDLASGVVRENPVFAIQRATAPLAGSGRGFTVNFRVDDLRAYLNSIEERGAVKEGEILEWARGRHAWIRDPEGNRIEIYEEILVP
jgi:predicted enzyme related to lactoylglutathione lyase